jgi:membrane protease YdiL (CAAX protease family)
MSKRSQADAVLEGAAPSWQTLRPSLLTGFVIAYVAAVLTVDALAFLGVTWPFDWRIFRWRPFELYRCALGLGIDRDALAWLAADSLQRLDVFKLLCWFILPLVLSLRRFEWDWLGVKRCKRSDLLILAGVLVVGLAAIALMGYSQTLRSYYPDLSGHSADWKWSFFVQQSFWIFSWLPGWELLHRYLLLRRAAIQWPRFGWLLIPFFEVTYHLMKPGLEALGMAIFSLLLTWWALKRRNLLLPLLAHLIIELELVLFLLL